jgi:hypothetical protein
MTTDNSGIQRWLFYIGALLLSGSLLGQGPSDGEQIQSLVRDFTAKQKIGADISSLLSPQMPASRRYEEAASIAGPYLEYEFSEFGQVAVNGDHAQLSARLHAKTRSQGLDIPVKLMFEKAGRSWYFATFDGLSFPMLEWVAAMSVGGLYAITCLAFWVHIKRRQFPKRLLWEALILTPIGWALYPALKPWQASANL